MYRHRPRPIWMRSQPCWPGARTELQAFRLICGLLYISPQDAAMTFRNPLRPGLFAGLFCLIALSACSASALGESTQAVPPPKLDTPHASQHGTQTAVFAGGCFWGLQWVFEHVKGVTNVTAGYSGGAANTAQYERVSDGGTGHAESVQVTFDPAQVSYGELLQVYFSVATDPTELN